jgi:hypothetical protein
VRSVVANVFSAGTGDGWRRLSIVSVGIRDCREEAELLEQLAVIV